MYRRITSARGQVGPCTSILGEAPSGFGRRGRTSVAHCRRPHRVRARFAVRGVAGAGGWIGCRVVGRGPGRHSRGRCGERRHAGGQATPSRSRAHAAYRPSSPRVADRTSRGGGRVSRERATRGGNANGRRRGGSGLPAGSASYRPAPTAREALSQVPDTHRAGDGGVEPVSHPLSTRSYSSLPTRTDGFFPTVGNRPHHYRICGPFGKARTH